MRPPLPIRIRALSKRYGDAVAALDDVDLEVGAGEFLTLLGPSGSGKTTLLMTLAGFTQPTGGSIQLGAEEVVDVPPHRRGLGVVFQNYALFPHMSVARNVAYPLRLRGVRGGECARRVEEALDMVRLAGLGGRRVQELSGGQRQRVALARAMVFGPRVLLMDEPLSALDKSLREQMQLEIRQLHRKLGTTTVYVTHDQREALTMSDRIAVMNRGRIVQLGTPSEIYDRPADTFVAGFMGDTTLVPVTHGPSGPEAAGCRIVAPSTPPQGECFLVLRPERLTAVEAGDGAPGQNVFTGTVADCIFQGATWSVAVELPGGTVCSVGHDLARGPLPGVGEPFRFGLPVLRTAIVPAAPA